MIEEEMMDAVRFIRTGQHGLPVPRRHTPGAAGIDLMSSEHVTIPAGQQLPVPTGWAWDMGNWYEVYGRIEPKSGLAVKHGIAVQAGVIDTDYQGEIIVVLINHGPNYVHFKPGDRIAQLIVEQCKMADTYEGDEFMSNTHRKDGGFGSTGS